MNGFDLVFAKYVQEHSPVAISAAIQRFGKTLSTLKRTMKEINALLPEPFHLHVDNQNIVTRMGYGEYIELLDTIKFNRYITSPEERTRDLFVALCLNDVVNKSEYYQRFFVSASTLKNDAPVLQQFLQDKRLTLQSVPRKGSTLAGDEIALRIAVCLTILKTVEIGEDNRLIAHKANDPVNRSVALCFLSQCEAQITRAATLYTERLAPTLKLSYNGKKYFLVYLSLAMHRLKRGHEIIDVSELGFITTVPFTLFESPPENQFLDVLIASLSATSRAFTLYDRPLIEKVGHFLDRIAPALTTTLNNLQACFAEVYQFIYSAIIQNKFHLWFEDKKLQGVRATYPQLWESVRQALAFIEQHYAIRFSGVHLATLLLIVKKYELQNRLVSEPRKRIIIVTNSSESKIGYFKEVLHAWFHIDIVACVNINELHQLNTIPFDLLITFTNKISSYLKYYQLDYIKVNFHLTQDDITLLRQQGLSRAKKKIPAAQFAKLAAGMDEQQLHAFVTERYPGIFI